MKTLAIIQARLGSTRLPRKVLAEIAGKSVLAHVIGRARQIKGVDDVIVAVPPADRAEFQRELDRYALFGVGVSLYDPSCDEADVLGRFDQVAAHYQADTIMRLTADCPLLDPELCRRVLQLYVVLHDSRFYCANDTSRSGFPDGTDCEVFSAHALRMAARQATDPFEREHVTVWMRRHLPSYGILAPSGVQLGATQWSVNTPEELARVCRIVHHLAPGRTDWQATREAEEKVGADG